MSKLIFNQLNQIPTAQKQPSFNLIEHLRLKRLENPDLEDLFDFCTCAHLESGHNLTTKNCDYDFCICKKFRQAEFNLNISVLVIDIFKFENPDGFLEDDPRFWVEFAKWRKRNETKTI